MHMRSLRYSAAFLLVTLLVSAPLAAQVRWRTGASELSSKTRAEMIAALTVEAERGRHVVIQFDRPMTAALRAQLQAAGVTTTSYVGDNAFFAAVPAGGAAASVINIQSLIDTQEIQLSWKLHPTLARGTQPQWAVVPVPVERSDDPAAAGRTWIGAYVLFYDDVTAAEAALVAESQGIVIRRWLRSVNGLVIEIPLDAVPALAAEDAVQYIEPALPAMSAVNDSNRLITEADAVQAPPYDLDGAGVSVLVYDAGTARASHVDFEGRLTARDASGVHDHATHVAGTIGGAGVGDLLLKGMAPGVTIESYGFEQVGGLHEGFLYTDPGDIEADYDEALNSTLR